jgi:hypothetical protein
VIFPDVASMKSTLALGFVLAMTASAHAAAIQPVVVELFTSQGCSSCPPANANFRAIADRPDVLALSFSVTYWDYLGWKDTFGRTEFTQRQYDYARSLGHAAPFTPQVVINGNADVVGNVKSDIEKLIGGEKPLGGPAIAVTGSRVSIGANAHSSSPATVWLVRYDPHVVNVPVGRGENSGVTLPHRNVVHALVKLGSWTGAAESFALPPAPQGMNTAVLVQQPGGPILSALKV